MFIFALSAGFPASYQARSLTQAAIQAFSAPPRDGVRFAHAPRASGAIARWVVSDRDEQAQPVWDPDSGVLFAGDVRLYNRAELVGELGLAPPALQYSDVELSRLAYLRWGAESPRHLIGDFAFAAWDERAGVAFAARDHLGIRPLYYHCAADGIIFASDPAQIIGAVPALGREVSGERVLDFFAWQISDARRTFFSGIRRVLPGHGLRIDARSVTESRYWLPPADVDDGTPYPQALEEVRAIFRRAVKDRLDSRRPLVAHASGGFDSSTVVTVADRIYKDEPGRPPLTILSGLTPGFACDESAYMNAVASAVSFDLVSWDVVAETPPSFPGVQRRAPYPRSGIGGGPPRDLEVAHERDAGVLLTGLLGDDVWRATGVLRDFVVRGRWLRAARTLTRRGLRLVNRTDIEELVLAWLSPRAAVRVSHRHYDSRPVVSEWWGPELRSIGPLRSQSAHLPDVPWPSHLICGSWAQLTHPKAWLPIEGMTEYAIDAGLEVRSPHADVRLIERVLKIPWHQREPRGHYRSAGYDALGQYLPPEFALRVQQAPWADVWEATARRGLPSFSSYIQDGRWLSAPYVDRGLARGMLRRIAAPNQSGPEYRLVQQFAYLEAWLRMILS